MPANTSPIFIKQGNFFPVAITAANTSNVGSGTAGSTIFAVVSAATDGTRVDGVRFRNAGASANNASVATRFCVFLSDVTGATSTNRLIGEVAQAAGTARSATNIGATSIITFDQPIIMRSGQVMYVTSTTWTTNADDTHAIAFASDY